mgnify:CR=1 FL=1
MEEYSEPNKLVPFGQTPIENDPEDEIKLYMPNRRERKSKLFSSTKQCFARTEERLRCSSKVRTASYWVCRGIWE